MELIYPSIDPPKALHPIPSVCIGDLLYILSLCHSLIMLLISRENKNSYLY